MSSIRATKLFVLLLCLGLSACGSMTDDLFPSGADKRPAARPGTTGHLPGQDAADFSLPDIDGGDFVLSEHEQGGTDPADAVVLYWTMWCPVCSAHMDHLQFQVIPDYAGHDVRFVVIDYVNATVAQSLRARDEGGFAGSPFTVLADTAQEVTSLYHATMGSTVVIDGDGVVRMNEDFKDGSKLVQTLDAVLGL